MHLLGGVGGGLVPSRVPGAGFETHGDAGAMPVVFGGCGALPLGLHHLGGVGGGFVPSRVPGAGFETYGDAGAMSVVFRGCGALPLGLHCEIVLGLGIISKAPSSNAKLKI